MEFLRFGSSIPGSYWGCCAVCIIQNFERGPDAPASIELVDGDGGHPIGLPDGKGTAYLGKTELEVFQQRLRIGTFSNRDMPNHTFFAILTARQISGGVGQKWLKILKEHGFEFVRAVGNSVYTGDKLFDDKDAAEKSSRINYIFALYRNIGKGTVENAFLPPKAWTDLDSVVNEPFLDGVFDGKTTTSIIREQQRALWDKLPDNVRYTEAELTAAGVPVTKAGQRSKFPQEPLTTRQSKLEAAKKPATSAMSAMAPAPISKE